MLKTMLHNKKKDSRIKKTPLLTKRGFTLLEVAVALFVFSIAMIAVTGIFVSFFNANRSTKTAQKSLEDAQQAMNLLAKNIRTSSVAASSANTIRFFEYSNDGLPPCREYHFSATNIQYSTPVAAASKAACASLGSMAGTYANLLDTSVTGSFIAYPSAPGSVGKVTIIMQVLQGSIRIPIQSTVSLRDYQESNL